MIAKSRWIRVRGVLWTASALALLFASGEILIGDVNRELIGRGATSDGFELFAGPQLVLASNQLRCTIQNDADVCVISDQGDGGVFPTGTSDNYIFNSGFQIAGITDATAGPWAGDTVGAYLMDASGNQHHGSALTDIYDSQNPDDIANWHNVNFSQAFACS